MKFRDIFTFKNTEWNIYYRFSNSEWIKYLGNKGYWYADPILYKKNKNIYLFMEAFEKKTQIGRIALARLKDGVFSSPKIIIRKPYHMSYPCVFGYGDSTYMIPESSQNHSIELYKAVDDSLEKWELDKILGNCIHCVDSTIVQRNDSLYLISYVQNKSGYITKIFELDMIEKKLKDYKEIKHKQNKFRPAGKIYEQNNMIIRPVQDCRDCYGEKIRLLRINTKNNDLLGEEIGTIDTEILHDFPIQRVHTIGMIDDIEVVDALEERTCIWTPILIMKRKMHNFRYKILFWGKD